MKKQIISSTTPVIRNDINEETNLMSLAPETASINDSETGAPGTSGTHSQQSRPKNSKPLDTSIDDFCEHEVNIITANPKRDLLKIGGSSRIAIFPFSIQPSGKAQEVPCGDAGTDKMHTENINKICQRSVYGMVGRHDLENTSYIKLLVQVMEQKLKECGPRNVVGQQRASLKLLTVENVLPRDLPEELKGLKPVVIPELSPEKFSTFLLGIIDTFYKNIIQSMAELHYGPRLKMTVEPHEVGVGLEQYLGRVQTALSEVFCDSNSYPRQQLLQLHHIPNVSVIQHLSQEKYKVCVEIQPNQIEDFVSFIRSYLKNDFQTMLKTNVRINGQAYHGQIRCTIDISTIHHVLRCLHPKLYTEQRRKIDGLLTDDTHLDDLCKIIEEKPSVDKLNNRGVPTLKVMTASAIYTAHIENTDYSPFHYLMYLKKAGVPDCLDIVQNWNGYNALHLALINDRMDFLKMLFYMNYWGKLRNGIVIPVNVSDEQNYLYFTPKRVADALSHKEKGSTIQLQFDILDRIYRNMPAICKCALQGDMEKVRILVDSKPHLLEQKDDNGSHCLFYACGAGHTEIVDYLLAKGAPRKVQNCDKESPEHMAWMCGHLPVLEVLSNNFFDIRGRDDKNGYAAVHFSAMYGDIEGLKFYRSKGFKLDPKALTAAAKCNQTEAFKEIMSADNIDVNSGEDKEGLLALHYTVMKKNKECLEILLEKGAKIDKKDRYNRNVFHFAAETGDVEIFEILLKAAVKEKCTSLLQEHDHYYGKKLLYIIRGKDRGRRAWHWAELNRLQHKAFKDRVRHGQVDVQSYGRILMSGFGKGPNQEQRKEMEAKLEKNKDKQEPDLTPLHVAVMEDKYEIVDRLIREKCNIEAKDKDGSRPMHLAAMIGKVNMLQRLIEEGASPLELNNKEKTPLNIAVDNVNHAAVNFLSAQEPMTEAEKFLEISLKKLIGDLDEKKLDSQREAGEDIRRVIIDHLRDLTIDINVFLRDLGSGPVQEASDP